MLYDDDGETFDYEKGIYSWREINITEGRNDRFSGSISKPAKGMPDNIGKVTFRFYDNRIIGINQTRFF